MNETAALPASESHRVWTSFWSNQHHKFWIPPAGAGRSFNSYPGMAFSLGRLL